MNNLGDYLDKKAQKLDLGRADDLGEVQKLLEKWYPGKVKAQSLNKGTLRLVTTSSSVANELRFRQQEILAVVPGVKKIILR